MNLNSMSLKYSQCSKSKPTGCKTHTLIFVECRGPYVGYDSNAASCTLPYLINWLQKKISLDSSVENEQINHVKSDRQN